MAKRKQKWSVWDRTLTKVIVIAWINVIAFIGPIILSSKSNLEAFAGVIVITGLTALSGFHYLRWRAIYD